MPDSTPRAGWYLDHHDKTLLRWWDGEAWTEHTTPATAPSPPEAATTGITTAPGAAHLTSDVLEADAYGTQVTLTSDEVIIQATNFASRGALGAKARSIPLTDITALDLTNPTKFKNGSLLIGTASGKTDVHHRSKHADGLTAIYERLCQAAAQALTGEAAQDALKRADMARGEGRTPEQAAREDAEKRAAAAEMAEMARTYEGVPAIEAQKYGFVLGKNERLYWVIPNATLIEVKHAKGHFQYNNTNVQFRVAKGISVGTGGGRGHYVPGPEGPTAIDEGQAAVTNQRVIFTGPRQSREWAFSKLTGIAHAPSGSWTALTVSNRQTTSGFGYPSDAVDETRFRLAIALADFQDARNELAASLEIPGE